MFVGLQRHGWPARTPAHGRRIHVPGGPVEGTAVKVFTGRVLRDTRTGVRALTCGVAVRGSSTGDPCLCSGTSANACALRMFVCDRCPVRKVGFRVRGRGVCGVAKPGDGSEHGKRIEGQVVLGSSPPHPTRPQRGYAAHWTRPWDAPATASIRVPRGANAASVGGTAPL